MSSSVLNDSASPLCLELDENTYNQIIYQQFAPAAKERGYTIETNKVGTQHVSNVSKYSSSRSDLVTYCPTALQGCVVFQPETISISEEPKEVTLRGSLTENKKDGSRDPMGQLLGGMEKLAGDIALKYIHSRPKELFNEIVIYGLTLSLQANECTGHKLTMNFNTNCSILESGDRQLTIVDGLNRLLTALER